MYQLISYSVVQSIHTLEYPLLTIRILNMHPVTFFNAHKVSTPTEEQKILQGDVSSTVLV
jgi:hypothetical protein